MTAGLGPQLGISLMTLIAVFLLVRFGYQPARAFIAAQRQMYDQVLRRQLLINIEPTTAMLMALSGIVIAVFVGIVVVDSVVAATALGVGALFLPQLILKHLATKRREKLESQLVDSLTTLSAGVRAGLTLVQSMQLLVKQHIGPVRQEFGQILREYEMGMELTQAMRNASDRIGSRIYRLTFTAVEMHRLRGGDTAESLDRIAESVREIQRLEGKLDALTSQGRTQAWMMAAMPVVFLLILYAIDSEGVTQMFVDPLGRLILLIVIIAIAIAFAWIRKIMAVDI